MAFDVGIHFTHTISRTPGDSIAVGLREGDGPNPDPVLFRAQHQAYLAALKTAGVEPTLLPALEPYPDSVFVEDPALCLPEGAIILRPGAESRLGEADAIRPALEVHFDQVISLDGTGFADGGDIMVTDREILVGLSERTNETGFQALEAIVAPWGYKMRMLVTPPSILHFKTASSYLGANTVFCTREMAESDLFGGYDLLLVPEGEEAAANAIRVNDTILISKGFPKTKTLLTNHFDGLKIVELETSEAARVDGGLSCMSLRFTKQA